MKERFQYVLLLLMLGPLFSCSSPRGVQVTIVETVNLPPDEMIENPFFSRSPLLLEAPDFANIRTEDYLPAFEEGMRRQLEEVERIVTEPAVPDFENSVVALERSGEIYRRVSRVFFNMTSANTNDELQRIQAELAPRLAAHADNILLNRDLFSRVESVYEVREELGLDRESERLLEETYRNFVRAGALLDDGRQTELRRLNERLAELVTRFQEKLLAMTRESSLLVEDESRLEGLSGSRKAAAREAAEERGHDRGWLLLLTNTTRQPILSELHDRELRRELWEASAWRGFGLEGAIDTRPILLEMVELRARKAELLGYSSWAEYVQERQMASDPEQVIAMLDTLIADVTVHTGSEAEAIREQMRRDGIEGDPMPWDWEFYAERVRRERFLYEEEEVRNYFELERVLEDGLFYTMERLYGIRFRERSDLPVYHQDVRVFDVLSPDEERIGLFYADLFERENKRGGAWMSSFVSQSHLLDQRPVVLNVLNIPRPPSGEPALLDFDQVTTLFHEMGHAVHGLFSDVRYPSLSGTSVPRDFVEFPSTFHEDWAAHPEVLSNYAFHHESGEPIPDDLLRRVIESRRFNQGFDTQEYLAAAVIDIRWHLLAAGEIPVDVESFERAAMERHGVLTEMVPPRYRSPYFSHIFAGGYSASYYAYIWSELLAADAFAWITRQGGLTRENGDRFREAVLSRGSAEEAMEIYLQFRGEEPDSRHLLERRGLQPVE